ncbi:uncharacterized protein LOC117135833 isoform X3 [Drosophila mauritiana]|uniref:Uncharacterized protein LOC117135833 isoform X3 n=1 Tax=Drosophila mauritiana TaxID=7226 RepID=A0A6P8JLZ7_DROMA|nr:uncharacterized protein LOC117135833 isoform X3 [Drosophila mauritiana]
MRSKAWQYQLLMHNQIMDQSQRDFILESEMSCVCTPIGECRSTGYQDDFSWVAIKKRNRLVPEPRRYLKDLRSEMYEKADAEKCHQPEMRNVQDFLECQVRRHMRLELQIPKYPNVP